MKIKQLLLTAILASSGTLIFGQQNTFPWLNTGNVGIGTTSPSHKLSVGVSKPLVASWASAIFNKGLAVSTGFGGAAVVLSDQGVSNPIRGLVAYDYSLGQYLDLYVGWGGKNVNLAYNGGKVGIGTTTPSETLDVEGNLIIGSSVNHRGTDGEGGKISFRRYSNGAEAFSMGITSHTSYGDKITFYSPAGGAHYVFANANGELMRIGYYGEVGIGTNKIAGYKLSVGGAMRAGSILVSNPSGWADYVFADDYQLNSLEEVEEFIEKNNHLPNVPSETEVLENGFDLAEMDAILLQKIEELTLYMIALKKENEELRGLIENN